MELQDIPTETDVLVIGGGPGGYVAAIRAAQRGLDVTLVERDAVGGTCLNYGCIPSKALITATGIARDAGDAETMGVRADPEIDVEQMVSWKDGVVDRLTGGVEALCETNGVTVVDGLANFVDTHEVSIRGPDGDETKLTFSDCIIATGSRPIEIPGFDFEDFPVLGSRDALSLSSIPESIVICGAGYIGLELAGVFADLGTEVTIVEMLDEALPGYPSDLTDPVTDSLEARGVTFQFGEAATEWWPTKDRIQVETETAEGETSRYLTDRVLVAVGREPVTDTLGLDAIGLEPEENGFLETDDQCRTEAAHIYAVGDVAGEPMLAHKASAEGITAAEVIAGEDVTYDPRMVPAVVFTDPEIATAGLTADEAAEAGYETTVGKFPLQSSGRALTTNQAEGFVELVADEASGQILGGRMVGPEASEVIAEIGLAVEQGLTLTDVASTIHSHPTLSESVMEAAEHALGQAVHTSNR
jgi:dihydrolipoamide dehydrogenase